MPPSTRPASGSPWPNAATSWSGTNSTWSSSACWRIGSSAMSGSRSSAGPSSPSRSAGRPGRAGRTARRPASRRACWWSPSRSRRSSGRAGCTRPAGRGRRRRRRAPAGGGCRARRTAATPSPCVGQPVEDRGEVARRRRRASRARPTNERRAGPARRRPRASESAAFISRVSGLSAASGSSVRSTTATRPGLPQRRGELRGRERPEDGDGDAADRPALRRAGGRRRRWRCRRSCPSRRGSSSASSVAVGVDQAVAPAGQRRPLGHRRRARAAGSGRRRRAGRCGPSCSCPGSGRRRSSAPRPGRTGRGCAARGSPTNSRSSSSSGRRTFSSVWVVRKPSWHDEERRLGRLGDAARDGASGRPPPGRCARRGSPQPVSATPMTSSWPAWMLSAWLVSARAPTWKTAGRRLPAMTYRTSFMRMRPWPAVKFVTRPPASAKPSAADADECSDSGSRKRSGVPHRFGLAVRDRGLVERRHGRRGRDRVGAGGLA